MDRRIAGYDLARSLAVFELVVANFSAGVEKAGFGLDRLIQTRLHSLMQGGSVATFLVLGGVGISLLAQRVRITNDAPGITDSRKRLIKRAAFLLVVGICCNLIWQTRFLCFYSICIIIGVLLLTASNRWLWSLAFVFVFIFVVFTFLVVNFFGYYEVIRNWETLRDSNSWTVEGIVFRLYFNRFHSIFSWAAFLLIGMWLGRQEVHYPRVRRDVCFGGIAVALFSVCAYWLLIRYVPSDLLSAIGMLFTPVYFLGICGTATATIGGGLMLTERYPDVKWTKPFIATGQLALTLYVAHLIIGRGILKALGVLDKTLPLAIGSAVIFCICAVVFSHFWRKRYDRGPLEWGIRRITG